MRNLNLPATERIAAGFVLASIVDHEPRYLLLRSAQHGTWSFPKGHAEPGELELETARRETEEETGITDLRVIPGFRREVRYEVQGRKTTWMKTVVWFAAVTPKPAHVQSAEHDQSGWYTLPNALKLLSYDTLKDLLQQADAAIRG